MSEAFRSLISTVHGKKDHRDDLNADEKRINDVGVRVDLLEALRNGVAHKFFVRIRDAEFPMRLLSVKESSEILQKVAKEAAANPEFERFGVLQTRRIMELMLEAATTSAPQAYDGIGLNTIQRLTAEELQALYDHWVMEVQKADPNIDEIPEGHFNQLVEALEKKQESVNECSLKLLRRIAREYLQMRTALRDSSYTS